MPEPEDKPPLSPSHDVEVPAGEAIRLGPVTMALIGISVVVALYSSLGYSQEKLLPLFIGLSPLTDAASALPEVRHGEVWRLFTPMFIHFGPIHLIFNMLWLKDLGGAIERRQGSGYFLVMVAVLSMLSDLGQYVVTGPLFGGMSGVVYGLFAYVWLRGVLDPASGYRMPAQTVLIMLGWFVFCFLGFLNVANAAHGAGLVVGAVWAFVATMFSRSGRGLVVNVQP